MPHNKPLDSSIAKEPELAALGAGGIPEKALKGRAVSYHAK
jgi:hypothetical protein